MDTTNKGERIRLLREAKELSQAELAKLLDTKRQTISKYENGIVTNIPSDRIEEMARILDTTPEYILGWPPKAPAEEEPIKEDKQAEPANDDGLSDNMRKLIDFAKSVPENKAEMILRVMQSIVESD